MTYKYHFFGDSMEIWKIQYSHLYEMTPNEKIEVEEYLKEQTDLGAWLFAPQFCGADAKWNLRLWFYKKKYGHMPEMKNKPNFWDWVDWMFASRKPC